MTYNYINYTSFININHKYVRALKKMITWYGLVSPPLPTVLHPVFSLQSRPVPCKAHDGGDMASSPPSLDLSTSSGGSDGSVS